MLLSGHDNQTVSRVLEGVRHIYEALSGPIVGCCVHADRGIFWIARRRVHAVESTIMLAVVGVCFHEREAASAHDGSGRWS